jgi:hypothetical protein
MSHSIASIFPLQSLLISKDELSSCFFRTPTTRELEFQEVFTTVQLLLSSDERRKLLRYHKKGRIGYDLVTIFGIQLLKLHYKVQTTKDTLFLLEENMNLRVILSISDVPSPATVSRLSRKVEKIIKPTIIHKRLIDHYNTEMNRIIGHISIDSTIIQAREKPLKKKKEPSLTSLKKRGRKKKGSHEEEEYHKRKAKEQQEKLDYLTESPQTSISALEMGCSMTAKQNSKGKRQWFTGFKAHLAADDFGITIAYAVTGACVHDCKVAVPLLKYVHQRNDFFYALMDKGYLNPDIDAYAQLIERKVIIDQRAHRGVAAIPMEEATALRYNARSTVERTNSELKDGFLPNKLYRRASHARYDIELAILLTTLKKVWKVLRLKEEIKAKRAS